MYAIGIKTFNGKLFADIIYQVEGISISGWIEKTMVVRHKFDEIYVVENFTQKMCEMSPSKLAEYVIINHLCKIK